MFDIGFPRDWSSLKKLIWLKAINGGGGAAGVWKTLSGTLIHITDALASPMQKCEVTLEPIQAGSGDPSPTNVRPISGWTGCDVYRTGVNVWDEEWEVGSYDDTTGKKISGTRLINKNMISVKPNTSYYLKLWSGSSNDMRILYYDKNGEYLYITGWLYQGEFTTPANAEFMNFFLAGSYGQSYNHDISINYPSTDTAYHAYSGTTLSVTFPDFVGTVYGGTVDVVSGVLTVDRAQIDLGTVNWGYYTSRTNPLFRAVPLVTDTKTYSSGTTPNILCSSYAVRATTSQNVLGDYMQDKSCAFVTNSMNFCIRDDSYTDAETFKSAVLGQKLVYELATPITYQLTPQQIATLNGENNLWGSGDIELTYKAQSS